MSAVDAGKYCDEGKGGDAVEAGVRVLYAVANVGVKDSVNDMGTDT